MSTEGDAAVAAATHLSGTAESSGGARLVLGPLLRYVGTTTATVWVETDAPSVIEVLGQRAETFHVAGHHYGLVLIEDLEPGSVNPYECRSTGALCGRRRTGDPAR